PDGGRRNGARRQVAFPRDRPLAPRDAPSLAGALLPFPRLSPDDHSRELDNSMNHAGPELKISVVTPSYNQGKFLRRTIESVLGQGYPSLEFIVIDGGSTDGSAGIIEEYQSRLTYWVSEPDHGQSEAINKGLQRCTGDILCWLNSDDFFEP